MPIGRSELAGWPLSGLAEPFDLGVNDRQLILQLLDPRLDIAPVRFEQLEPGVQCDTSLGSESGIFLHALNGHACIPQTMEEPQVLQIGLRIPAMAARIASDRLNQPGAFIVA